MLALTLGQAKAIAALVVVILVGGALAAAWIMKEITQKVTVALIFGLLAVLVWTQRSSLEECADKVRAAGLDFNDPDVDTTCSFFGRDVEIKRQTSE